jgi:hypothetical protein
MTLPPFPVDDATLDMLCAAMDPRSVGDYAVERSCMGEFLDMMSRLGGSDPAAVDEVIDGIHVMRDPMYHDHDVIKALVDEVRRLRSELTRG